MVEKLEKSNRSNKRSKLPVVLPEFNKYEYYLRSVQSPESDVSFIQEVYKARNRKLPKLLREDFCGTFALCKEWVANNSKNHAIGVDLDPEPLEYGKNVILPQLALSAQKRIKIVQGDVMTVRLEPADVICALNFSYFCFKERASLVKYFKRSRLGLADNGIMVVDCFGGARCHQTSEEETEYEDEGFSYFWDQDTFNPITHDAQFYIHFKRKHEAKREKVFSYDWRLWTIPELRDIFADAGFSKTSVYWEGTDEQDGESGNGIFTHSEVGDECEAWIAYIVAEK